MRKKLFVPIERISLACFRLLAVLLFEAQFALVCVAQTPAPTGAAVSSPAANLDCVKDILKKYEKHFGGGCEKESIAKSDAEKGFQTAMLAYVDALDAGVGGCKREAAVGDRLPPKDLLMLRQLNKVTDEKGEHVQFELGARFLQDIQAIYSPRPGTDAWMGTAAALACDGLLDSAHGGPVDWKFAKGDLSKPEIYADATLSTDAGKALALFCNQTSQETDLINAMVGSAGSHGVFDVYDSRFTSCYDLFTKVPNTLKLSKAVLVNTSQRNESNELISSYTSALQNWKTAIKPLEPHITAIGVASKNYLDKSTEYSQCVSKSLDPPALVQYNFFFQTADFMTELVLEGIRQQDYQDMLNQLADPEGTSIPASQYKTTKDPGNSTIPGVVGRKPMSFVRKLVEQPTSLDTCWQQFSAYLTKTLETKELKVKKLNDITNIPISKSSTTTPASSSAAYKDFLSKDEMTVGCAADAAAIADTTRPVMNSISCKDINPGIIKDSAKFIDDWVYNFRNGKVYDLEKALVSSVQGNAGSKSVAQDKDGNANVKTMNYVPCSLTRKSSMACLAEEAKNKYARFNSNGTLTLGHDWSDAQTERAMLHGLMDATVEFMTALAVIELEAGEIKVPDACLPLVESQASLSDSSGPSSDLQNKLKAYGLAGKDLKGVCEGKATGGSVSQNIMGMQGLAACEAMGSAYNSVNGHLSQVLACSIFTRADALLTKGIYSQAKFQNFADIMKQKMENYANANKDNWRCKWHNKKSECMDDVASHLNDQGDGGAYPTQVRNTFKAKYFSRTVIKGYQAD